MRLQTEYMSIKNCCMISSSDDFQAHQQHPQRRCCFSQTALLWFEVLPDLSLPLPGLSLAHPGLSPPHPGVSPVYLGLLPAHQGLSLAHPGAPRLLVGTPRPVASAPRYSDSRQECPPRVWYSPEIYASKFTLHIFSDTPGAFHWLKYILLMLSSHGHSYTHIWAWYCTVPLCGLSTAELMSGVCNGLGRT